MELPAPAQLASQSPLVQTVIPLDLLQTAALEPRPAGLPGQRRFPSPERPASLFHDEISLYSQETQDANRSGHWLGR